MILSINQLNCIVFKRECLIAFDYAVYIKDLNFFLASNLLLLDQPGYWLDIFISFDFCILSGQLYFKINSELAIYKIECII